MLQITFYCHYKRNVVIKIIQPSLVSFRSRQQKNADLCPVFHSRYVIELTYINHLIQGNILILMFLHAYWVNYVDSGYLHKI